MKTRSVALIAVGALFLASCGGGTETIDQSASEEEEEFVYESPLGEFLGWSNANFDEEAAQAEWAEQERDAQEAVAACMRDLGFEYIPVDRTAEQAYYEEQFDEEFEWGSDEWTAKYGFGISTQRFSQEQVGPDLVGNIWDIGIEQDAPPDPNQDYVDSLSESEREAYYEALWGAPDDYPIPVWDEEGREPTEEEMIAFDEEWEANYQPTGCEPTAYEAIFNEGGGGEEAYRAFDAEFGQEIQAFEQRFDSHPNVIAYRDGVRACIEEQGIQFLAEDDSYQYFENELNAAGLGWEDQDPFEGIDTSDFTDEDYERVWQEIQSRPLPPDQLAALAEIQAEEIATAVAMRDCGGGWDAEQRELGYIRIELEEEFLAANADRLAEYEGVFGN